MLDLPLYAKCPRCRGHKYVSAITEMGDGFRPTIREDFSCPICQATGEADMDLIIEMALNENDALELAE